MRSLLLVFLAGCATLPHSKTARFVDGSEDTSKAWICVPDDSQSNPKGVSCGDMAAVLGLTHSVPKLAPDAGTSQL
jgi:hypothetical protein